MGQKLNHPYNPVMPQVPTPSSTRECIIFPYDPVSQKFITSNYKPFQTQNQLSQQELDSFFEQVNVPIQKWHENYELYYDKIDFYACLWLICFILLPFLPFLCCWACSNQMKLIKALRNSVKQAKAVITEKNSELAKKGLTWVVPACFPQWIELWTNYPGRIPNRPHQLFIGNEKNTSTETESQEK